MCRKLCSVFIAAAVIAAVGSAFGQMAVGVAPADKDKPADPHLVGWWRFDDDTGKTAKDSSEHGRDATLEGGLSFEKDSVPGRVGKALKLDGRSGAVEVTGYKGISGTRPRTVAAWIKTKASRGQITSWGTDDFGKMLIFGFVRGRMGVTPSGGYLYINAAIHDDQWHHVAVVVEEAERPNLHDDVTLYVDGTLAEIHDIGLLDLWPIDTGGEQDLTIGRRFNGRIDEVRIYDRALQTKDIKALYASYGKAK